MARPGGVKARCTVCDHVFVVTPESGKPAEAAEDQAGRTASEVEEVEVPDVPESSEADEEFEETAPTGGSFSLDLDEKRGKEKSGGNKKNLLVALLLLLLIVAGGAAGVYFFAPELIPGLAPKAEEPAAGQNGEQEQARTPADEEPQRQADTAPAPEPEAGQDGEPAEVANVRNIVLSDIRQYYVDNDKAGRIFVVEGKAVNDFEAPKQNIEVQVSLLNAQGETLAEKSFLAGNTLDLYGLQNLSREKIQEALADQMGVASRNMNVQPGDGVPFMSVFFDPPAGVREFLVKVTNVESPS
jgi:hypothetical protein